MTGAQSVAQQAIAGQGILIVGELLRTMTGKVRTDREGNEREPYLVKLLVRDKPLVVEYWDESAVPRGLLSAERGDAVTVAVYEPRPYKDRVYWRGVGNRAEDE